MNIKFSDNDLKILNAALIELPYRVSAQLIANINKQIVEQQKNDKEEN